MSREICGGWWAKLKNRHPLALELLYFWVCLHGSGICPISTLTVFGGSLPLFAGNRRTASMPLILRNTAKASAAAVDASVSPFGPIYASTVTPSSRGSLAALNHDLSSISHPALSGNADTEPANIPGSLPCSEYSNTTRVPLKGFKQSQFLLSPSPISGISLWKVDLYNCSLARCSTSSLFWAFVSSVLASAAWVSRAATCPRKVRLPASSFFDRTSASDALLLASSIRASASFRIASWTLLPDFQTKYVETATRRIRNIYAAKNQLWCLVASSTAFWPESVGDWMFIMLIITVAVLAVAAARSNNRRMSAMRNKYCNTQKPRRRPRPASRTCQNGFGAR
jgi:hypothetical protein